MCYQILFPESSQKSLVNELSLEIGVCPLELSMAHQGLVLLPLLSFTFMSGLNGVVAPSHY